MAEREVRWQGAARTHLDYVVRRISDRDHIRSLLRPRMEYSAYALGQLEPGLFERTSWYWSRGDTGSGLVLHSRGGLDEATFVMGDASAISATAWSGVFPIVRARSMAALPRLCASTGTP